MQIKLQMVYIWILFILIIKVWRGKDRFMLLFWKSRIRSQTSTSRIFKTIIEWRTSAISLLNALRSYNSDFQFTSFGANKVVEYIHTFTHTFKIQGEVYYVIGLLNLLTMTFINLFKCILFVDYLQHPQTRMDHIKTEL